MKTMTAMPGDVGLTVAVIDGGPRVVTSSGQILGGVTGFDLSSSVDGLTQLTLTVICYKLESKD
jgi:hypothetical protein